METIILLAIFSALVATGIVYLGLSLQTGFLFMDNETQDSKQARPNIIFIMLDDLGYNDVSWNNPAVHTPNLEKLASSGVILNRNYVHSVCSPPCYRSRSELLTGKYAHRLGIQTFVVEPDRPLYIPLEEKLLGEHLQELGYTTHLLGKWHVGHCRTDYLPTRRGFDTFFGNWNGYLDSYTRCTQSRNGNDSAMDWRDQEEAYKTHQDVHVTDLIKERALSILQQKDEKPFFMFLSFPAPHVPIQVPDEYLSVYASVESQWRKEYLGMITHVDEAVGEVVALLNTIGLSDNTIIAMTSDNGGEVGPSSNYPLRGAKASSFEGGQRVPGFISGPKSIIRKYGYINDGYDNYKLVARYPGLADGWEQDGSIGLRISEYETVYTPRMERSSDFNSPLCAGTMGSPYNFTLFFQSIAYGTTLEDNYLLFDVEADPEERVDLSSKMPEKVEELLARLEKQIEQEIAPPEQIVYGIFTTQKDQTWITGWC